MNPSELATQIGITMEQAARGLRRFVLAVQSVAEKLDKPTLADKGYAIVNRRGRNKLVDIRKSRHE